MLEGEAEQCMTAVQLKLLADIRPMLIHGAGTNVQLFGDLFASLVGRDQSQHLALSRGKAFQTRLLCSQPLPPCPPVEQIARYLRTNEMLP